jgi:hypothetical protein
MRQILKIYQDGMGQKYHPQQKDVEQYCSGISSGV